MAETSKKRPGEPLAISTLFVALSTNADGDQGIVASIVPGLGSTPAVFSMPGMIERFTELLQHIASTSGETIEIAEFHRAGVLRTIKP